MQLGLADQLDIGPGTAVWVSGIALFLAALAGRTARVAVLVLATLAMTFGGALYMSADLGASPLDALMTGIYRHTPFSLRVVRIGLECFGLALGWMLGGKVGVGTVFIGLTVGPLLQFWLKVLRAHPRKHVDHALDLDVV